MKRLLFHFMFWVFGAVLVVLIRTVGFIGFGLADVYDMMALGTADPQLITGAISEVIVNSILAVIFYTIVAYPAYYLMKRRVKYPSLLVTVLLVLIICFSVNSAWIMFVVKIIAAGTFIWMALHLPNRVSARRKYSSFKEHDLN